MPFNRLSSRGGQAVHIARVEADVVQGRQATGFSAIQVDMANAGATWVDQEVVRDANLITSRTPDELPAFMRTIIAAALETAE